MNYRKIGLVVSLGVLGFGVAIARSPRNGSVMEYDVQIDVYRPGVTENVRGAKASDFDTGEDWGSIGATDAQGNLTGLNFPNKSGRTIRGMQFLVKNPGSDSFSAKSSGGGAFPEVWRKKDGSELIFRGGEIAPDDDFWMQVPATPPNDYQRFTALLFDVDGQPPIPNAAEWEQLASSAVPNSVFNSAPGLTSLATAADLAVHDPSRLAWRFFVEVNRSANNGTTDAIWETWASDIETFPANPDPSNPPRWPGKRSRAKILRPSVKLTQMTPVAGQSAPAVPPLGATQEVRRNKATFDFIMTNRLWYLEGLTDAFKVGEKVDFPTSSIEIKADWRPISPQEKLRYHWSTDQTGQLIGLVAMHISSKVLPNWFWATFEHVDNPERGKVLGCHDSFGIAPPDDCHGNVSHALSTLLKKSGLGDEWRFYRLDGIQTDFVDSTGRPIALGSSIIEGRFVIRSSCVRCHAMARVDGSRVGDFEFVLGTPDPQLFYNPDGSRKSLQLDFVWGFGFARSANLSWFSVNWNLG